MFLEAKSHVWEHVKVLKDLFFILHFEIRSIKRLKICKKKTCCLRGRGQKSAKNVKRIIWTALIMDGKYEQLKKNWFLVCWHFNLWILFLSYFCFVTSSYIVNRLWLEKGWNEMIFLVQNFSKQKKKFK